MSETGKSLWVGVLAGLVIAAVAAPAAIYFWQTYSADRAEARDQLTTLAQRLDKTNGALTDMQKAASLAGVTRQLDELNGRIQSTNVALAELQKTSAGLERASLEKIADRLDKLDTGLKGNNEQLAALQKSAPLANLGKQIGQVEANLTSLEVTLAELKKSAAGGDYGKRFDSLDASIKTMDEKLAAIKQPDVSGATARLQALDASVKSLGDKIAAIKQPDTAARLDALDGEVKALGARLTDIKSALEASGNGLVEMQKAIAAAPVTGSPAPQVVRTLDDIKKGVDAAAADRGKLLAGLSGLQKSVQAGLKKPAGAGDEGATDLVVIHVQPQSAGQSAEAGATADVTTAPLSVEFKRVGSTKDTKQTEAIIAQLKKIIKPGEKCAISVAGYADTLGDDNFNLEVSKQRAHNVAEGLRKVLANDDVQIAETAWGERRLKQWTPNETPNEANRRVDISVHCQP